MSLYTYNFLALQKTINSLAYMHTSAVIHTWFPKNIVYNGYKMYFWPVTIKNISADIFIFISINNGHIGRSNDFPPVMVVPQNIYRNSNIDVATFIPETYHCLMWYQKEYLHNYKIPSVISGDIVNFYHEPNLYRIYHEPGSIDFYRKGQFIYNVLPILENRIVSKERTQIIDAIFNYKNILPEDILNGKYLTKDKEITTIDYISMFCDWFLKTYDEDFGNIDIKNLQNYYLKKRFGPLTLPMATKSKSVKKEWE